VNIPLLRRLQDAQGGFVPLSELGPDPVRCRGDIEELEAFGFGFEHHPYRGVAYRMPAARLCPDQIEDGLGTRRIGRRIAVWNRVTSTNDLAVRASGSTANEGLVVFAEEQSAGRGRRGRSWTAPPGTSILMSVLLFPPPALAETAWLTALGAVATAEVVAGVHGLGPGGGLDVRIKWPNDVRIRGSKVAGILVECGQGAVIGIGVNANVAAGDFSEELRATATSLQILADRPVDRSELARDLIRRLDHWYDLGRSEGPGSLNRAWRDRSEHLGRPVCVTTMDGPLVGRLDDLHLQHGLSLTLRDGRRRQVRLDEVRSMLPIDVEPGG
jgi:BirA family biotin operon repressor/biotin-[acetyl-CoA-carboxylase] ligase